MTLRGTAEVMLWRQILPSVGKYLSVDGQASGRRSYILSGIAGNKRQAWLLPGS